MHAEAYRAYCLSLPGAVEDFPFGEDTIVFKVGGKIFTLAGLFPFDAINVKCDPEKALELRAEFSCVRPGYHMNKKHWNTIDLDGTGDDKQVFQWIKDSYDIVVAALPKTVRESLS